MIITETRDIPSTQTLDCDVCIIGSGPAGATLASELVGGATKVLVLESGLQRRSPEIDSLNEIESVGAPRTMDQWQVRNRIVGGTSHSWTGRCVPLDAIDFETRAWVPHSGWPFGSAELLPYLGRAAGHLGLGAGHGFSDERFWTMSRRLPPRAALDGTLLEPFFWQFSRDTYNRFDITRFGRRLDRQDAPNVRILTDATVIQIDTNESGRAVETVDIATLDGSRRTVRAGTVVLCAGGIENARLLLASKSRFPRGLGNAHDLVGRFLMDHPRGALATLDLRTDWARTRLFGFHNIRGPRGAHLYCQGMRLSPAAQHAEGLLNCTAWLSEFVAPDDPWTAVKRVLRNDQRSWQDARSIALHLPLMARGLFHNYALGNGMPRRLLRLELNGTVEQQPNPDSRITLADRTDRFGVPLSRIDWRISPLEQHSLRRFAQHIRSELVRLGLPEPELADWVVHNTPLPPSFRDVAHPTGTTRMADDPTMGVVDANGCVHGVDGLFVAGSSTFPTSGHANPTLTVVALAIRLADHIKRRVAG